MLSDIVNVCMLLWMVHVTGTIIQIYCSKSLAKKSKTRVLFFPDTKVACKTFVDGKSCSNRSCEYAHVYTSETEGNESASSEN